MGNDQLCQGGEFHSDDSRHFRFIVFSPTRLFCLPRSGGQEVDSGARRNSEPLSVWDRIPRRLRSDSKPNASPCRWRPGRTPRRRLSTQTLSPIEELEEEHSSIVGHSAE